MPLKYPHALLAAPLNINYLLKLVLWIVRILHTRRLSLRHIVLWPGKLKLHIRVHVLWIRHVVINASLDAHFQLVVRQIRVTLDHVECLTLVVVFRQVGFRSEIKEKLSNQLIIKYLVIVKVLNSKKLIIKFN